MPILSTAAPLARHLVDIVDFKWLMAGAVHRVHMERLQAVADYAAHCLALGAASHTPALRDAAQRLAAALNLPPPGTCAAG